MGIKYQEQEQWYRRENWTLHILMSGDGHTEKDWRRAQITNAMEYKCCQGFLLKYVPVALFWITGCRNSEMALCLQSSKHFLEPWWIKWAKCMYVETDL